VVEHKQCTTKEKEETVTHLTIDLILRN